MEEGIRRTLPNDMEAERSVIGAILMDADTVEYAIDHLQASDFYHPAYRQIFSAMVALNQEMSPIDIITVQNKLREMDTPEDLISYQFLSDIFSSVITSANIKHHIRIVKDKSLLRSLIRTTEQVTNECYEAADTTQAIFAHAEKNIFDALQDQGSSDFTSITDLSLEALKEIQKTAENPGKLTGLSTGFIDLNGMTGGLQPSNLVLIAARPSMGKTALALNIADAVSVRGNHTTAIFSLEMAASEVVKRMISTNAKVDAVSIRDGNLQQKQWEDLTDSVIQIGDSSLFIDDTAGISISKMRSKCRKLKLEKGLDLIIIDYLQLMSSDEKRVESRQNEISNISRSLKALAREMNCPVIALSQLSRSVETRKGDNHRPILSDLRESGAIEQDADVVMMIYRDDYYNKDSEEKGIAEIIIAKQRNGPVGTVKLKWEPRHTRFYNLEKKEYHP